MAFGTLVSDMILHNGAIWCGMDDGQCQAVAIWQGNVAGDRLANAQGRSSYMFTAQTGR